MDAPKPRILIVDEEEPVAKALEYLLEREGFEVQALSGEDALLAAARNRTPDLILLEVTENPSRGLDVLARIRGDEELRRAAVILVTSRSRPKDVVAGLDRGADDFILKPYDPKEVVARLKAQIRIRNLQNELLAAERWRVLLETSGAVAHEMSQPLTAIMGNLELMLHRMSADDAHRHLVLRILENGERAVELLRKLQKIEAYELKDYPGTAKILDLERSSRPDPDAVPVSRRTH